MPVIIANDDTKLSTRGAIIYLSGSPAFVICTKDNTTIGAPHSCREILCGRFHIYYRKASREKYAINFSVLEKYRDKILESPQVLKLIDGVKVLNDLETRVSLKKTTVKIVRSENVKILNKATATYYSSLQKTAKVFTVFGIIEVDKAWMSSPAMLSLHSAMLRLYNKLAEGSKKPDTNYDALYYAVKNKSLKSADYEKVFKRIDMWTVMLLNCKNIFPKKFMSFKRNWFYDGYASTNGIQDFLSRGGGSDQVARGVLAHFLQE